MCSLRKGLAEQIMDKRNKMELFRKGRKNFFKRGYENGLKWDAEVFMFVRKKDKSYTFTNMSHPFCTCQADRSTDIAKTAADFEPASRVKTPTVSPSKESSLSALGIRTPMTPRLDLWLQGGLSKKGGENNRLVKESRT